MPKRVESAREAYKKGSLEESRKQHTSKAIHAPEKHASGASAYLKDMVYGGLDGIITTFAVVSGVTGAALSSVIILILGFANMFGDGISMAIGNYLGTKSERDFYNTEKRREEWEVEHMPEGEREEIRYIYSQKGFRGKDLETAVRVITSDKKLWVEEMMRSELGMMESEKSPAKAGLATFLAFVGAGFIPLVSYILAISVPFLQPHSFVIAVILTATAIFIVGSARSLVIDKKWYVAGAEMLAVGGLAAIAAYYIGYLMSILV